MLLKQGHVAPKWKSSQQGLFGRNHELADSYEISLGTKDTKRRQAIQNTQKTKMMSKTDLSKQNLG
jgi:hypothetical protein